ncbi:hypothetical protein [Roseateles asaccharophilus]|uniref:Uncharacterized protein n=1 Tax=Roseateles asaccharophilus TaxID=582607 RepID=A0ABU2AC19_9BURK|nr:hypothetical protein [Roseateles asaccharophilus]MDR7334138.1 hypothetical protein [Roseateles asaccharophilus]
MSLMPRQQELVRDLPQRARQLHRFAREAYRRWGDSLPRPPVSFNRVGAAV